MLCRSLQCTAKFLNKNRIHLSLVPAVIPRTWVTEGINEHVITGIYVGPSECSVVRHENMHFGGKPRRACDYTHRKNVMNGSAAQGIVLLNF